MCARLNFAPNIDPNLYFRIVDKYLELGAIPSSDAFEKVGEYVNLSAIDIESFIKKQISPILKTLHSDGTFEAKSREQKRTQILHVLLRPLNSLNNMDIRVVMDVVTAETPKNAGLRLNVPDSEITTILRKVKVACVQLGLNYIERETFTKQQIDQIIQKMQEIQQKKLLPTQRQNLFSVNLKTDNPELDAKRLIKLYSSDSQKEPVQTQGLFNNQYSETKPVSTNEEESTNHNRPWEL